jgi:hypothetical protein
MLPSQKRTKTASVGGGGQKRQKVSAGLGRIVALYCCAFTSYHIC